MTLIKLSQFNTEFEIIFENNFYKAKCSGKVIFEDLNYEKVRSVLFG